MNYFYDNEKRIHYMHFDSMLDLEKTPVAECNVHEWEGVKREFASSGTSWYGWPDGMHGTYRRMRDGWPEGLEMARRLLPDVEIPVMRSVRRKRVRGATGNEIDIHRVYNGMLDSAWDTTMREAKESRGTFNAVVMVQSRTAAGVRPEEAFWRAAAASLIADELQKSGRGVQVILNMANSDMFRNDASQSNVSVMLKDFSDVLDIERLIVACSIGYYRTEMFRAKCVIPSLIDRRLGLKSYERIIPLHIQQANTFVFEIPETTHTRGQAEALLRRVKEELQ